MNATARYAFTPVQDAFIRAFLNGSYSTSELVRHERSVLSLRDRLPPVYQQAMRGTCVANAATALLEYYEDCKTRLSVQFLHEMTKLKEREWLDRNLKALEDNEDVDAEFAAKFPAQVAQIRLTSDANGAGSPAAKAFVGAFARQLGGYFNSHTGSQIKRCFEVIREYGTCRYSLWPYANVQTEEAVVGASFPPGSREDALKHRIPTGLYLLHSPNNVEEIRGILAGANGRRPMPVCVGLPLFEGCDGERFKFPEAHEENGRLVSDNALKDVHEMLIVGFEDDKMVAGGGWFEVRNSWGANWGDNGYGKVPYAYVECFCTEAGTILQNMVDYVADGYGANAARPVAVPRGYGAKDRSLGWILLSCGLVGLALATGVLLVRQTSMRRNSEPESADKPLEKSEIVGGGTKAKDKEAERLRAEEESRRLAEERLAIEAEKTRLTQERRAAEERVEAAAKAAAEAKAKREAEEKAVAEAKAQREAEEKRIAAVKAAVEAAEKARLAEEKRLAEAKRLEDERRAAEKKAEEERIAAEKKRMEAERSKPREYIVHVAIVCNTEAERTTVEGCLRGLSEEKKDGVTYAVGNISVTEHDAGRNMFGMTQKGYRLKCDMTILSLNGSIQRPTDSAKGYLGAILNEKCQIEGEDRIDWSNFTRSTYQQDFRTVSGVRTGF